MQGSLVRLRGMNYILLDESGDLGFSIERGSSKFFVVTVAFTKSKRSFEKIVRKVHRGLRKKFRKVGILHAYRETPITRTRVLKAVNEQDCSILAIVLNKKKVYTKLQDEKPVLYNYVTNILLDRLFTRQPIPSNEPIILIASQRETNKFLNQNFTYYLQNEIKGSHKIKLQIEIASPLREKSLQAVDFVSWAVFRKYEIGDEVYYNLIRRKIIEEALLFP